MDLGWRYRTRAGSPRYLGQFLQSVPELDKLDETHVVPETLGWDLWVRPVKNEFINPAYREGWSL